MSHKVMVFHQHNATDFHPDAVGVFFASYPQDTEQLALASAAQRVKATGVPEEEQAGGADQLPVVV